VFITEEKILKKIFQERSRGNLDRARKHALKGYEKWPGNFDICMELIHLCIESSDYHEAVKYMKSAAKKNPATRNEIIQFATESFYNHADPFLGSFIIESYIRSSDIEKVRNFLGGVSAEYIQSLIKRSQTKSEGLIQRGDTGSAAFTDNELLLGILYAQNGQRREAVTPLGNAMHNCPEQAEAIGSLLLEFQRDLPGCAKLEFQLGMASVYLNHPDKAEKRFFNAIRMEDPPLEKILSVIDEKETGENHLMLRGEILIRLGNQAEGIEAIIEFLSREQEGWNEQPEDKIKQLFPAHVDRKSMVHDRLSLLPEKILYKKDVIFLLCDICSDLGNYIDATNHLEELAEFSPGATGEIIKRIEEREEILQTAPGRKLLAILYLRSGEYGKCREHFSAAAEMDPELIPELIKLVNARVDEEGRDTALVKILIDLYTRTGESDRAHSLLQELKEQENLSGDEAIEMTTRVIENCGATVENIVSAVEFSSEKGETEKMVPHLVEFCRVNPDKQESLASELKELADSRDRLYSFLAELIGQASRDIKLSENMKYLHAVSLLHSGEIEKSVFAFDQILMFNEEIKLDVMAQYESVVANHPDNSTLLLALYQMHLDEEQYVQAAHYLGKFLESDPTQIRDVITRFNQIVEKMPAEPEVWKQMLESALSIDHGNLAHQILERAVSAMGEVEAAPLHIYGAMLYRENRDIEESLKCLAIALTSERSDLKSIENELEKIISISPENAGAMYLCGETCTRMGEEERAVEYYSRCIKTSPQYSDRVRERLQQALPFSVRPWLINRLLGTMEWRKGNHQEAINLFARAQKGEKKSLAALGKELRGYLESPSASTGLRRLYAENLRLEGKFREAVEQVEILIGESDFNSSEAAGFLKLVIGEDQHQFEANRLLARILLEEGKTEESLQPAVNMLSSSEAEPAEMERSVEELIRVHGDDSGFLLRIGSVKLKLGKEQESLGYLRQALDRNSDHCREILESLSGRDWSAAYNCQAKLLEADCLIESEEYGKSYEVLRDITDEPGRDLLDLLERAELLIRNQPEKRYFSLALQLKAKQNDLSGARALIELAESALNPEDIADLRIELAGLADIEGLEQEASTLYSEVLRNSENRENILKLIEDSLIKLARERLASAGNTEDLAGGEEAEISVLVETAIQLGEYQVSMQILEKAEPDEGSRLYNMGRIYLAMDRPAMAVSLLSSSISSPSLPQREKVPALYSLGRASEMTFDFGRAATAFMKILEIHGEYRDASKRASINYTRCLEDEAEIFTIEKTAALNDAN